MFRFQILSCHLVLNICIDESTSAISEVDVARPDLLMTPEFMSMISGSTQ